MRTSVDSLIGVEIRNWVLKELKAEVTVLDILSAMPINALSAKISHASGLVPEKLRNEASGETKEDAPQGAD